MRSLQCFGHCLQSPCWDGLFPFDFLILKEFHPLLGPIPKEKKLSDPNSLLMLQFKQLGKKEEGNKLLEYTFEPVISVMAESLYLNLWHPFK